MSFCLDHHHPLSVEEKEVGGAPGSSSTEKGSYLLLTEHIII